MGVEIEPDVPIHRQLDLCLNQRETDGRYCSKPKDHPATGHYWNLHLSGNKVGTEDTDSLSRYDQDIRRVEREANLSGLATHREMRNLVARTSNVIHLIVSDVGTLACGDPIGVGNGSFRKVTTDPDITTCKRCELGWMIYQRDQYKDMWENTERVLGDKLQELRAARDELIHLRYQLDEINRNAQGGQ